MRVELKKRFKQLFAEDGMFLTQANVANESERTFCTIACIPLTMDESTWTEWTQAQVEQWQQEHPIEEYEDEEYQ